MVIITSGKNWRGEDCEIYLNTLLLENITKIKSVVTKKDFDYVAIVAGLPGLGKSTFAINLAKFFCEWFDESYICFTADQFIEKTNSCSNRSAIILDESFASLNSKISLSSDFLKIINHLQLIRQKNLFIILCLPNFFDLNKGVAIYRASHLFVVYGKEFGDRGDFAAFGRDKKKELYVKGLKFMNYTCVQPNFRGEFHKQHVIDPNVYDKMKTEHRMKKELEVPESTPRVTIQRNILIKYLKEELKIPVKKISELTELELGTIYDILKNKKRTKN